MRVQVRANVFETNSSSTHSITITTQKDYDEWVAGKRLFDNEEEVILAPFTLTDDEQHEAIEAYYEEVKSQLFWANWNDLTDEAKQSWFDKWYVKNVLHDDEDWKRYVTYSEYRDDTDGYYWYDKSFVTPNGEKVVAFGYYGFN